MVEHKYNIGDKVRFKSNLIGDKDYESLAGKVVTITGQSWFNGPCYYVDLPVYFPSRDYWTFSEDSFEGKVD
jgi:hypothetical protein